MNLIEQIRDEVKKGRLILVKQEDAVQLLSAIPGCFGSHTFRFTENLNAAVEKAFAFDEGPEAEDEEPAAQAAQHKTGD